MNHIPAILGAVIAATGVLIWFYPQAISQYRRQPPEKKKHINIRAMSKVYLIDFVASGLVSTATYFILIGCGKTQIAEPISILILLVGLGIGITLAQRYDYNPQSRFKRYTPSGIVVIAAFIVGSLLIQGTKVNKAQLSNDTLYFTGQYGTEIAIDDIEKIDLLYQLPLIERKKNGFSMGERKKGHYILEQWGSCRLLIQSASGPFLYIRLKNGEQTVYNHSDSLLTIRVFKQLNAR